MSVKEDLVGGVETAAAETEDANVEEKPAEGNAEEEPTTDVEGKNEDLLTVAKDKEVELSGVNLKKDGNDLFRLMGIERNFSKRTQLRELVDNATVTTGVKLTPRLESFVEQARTPPVVKLAGVDLETDEDDLFAHFRIDKGDVASKSQLRYVVKRAKLLAQQQRLKLQQQQLRPPREEVSGHPPKTPATRINELTGTAPASHSLPPSPGCHLNVPPDSTEKSLLSAAKSFCQAVFADSGNMEIPATASLRRKPKLGDFSKVDLPHTQGEIDMRISFEPEWPPNLVGEQLSDIMKKEAPHNAILVGKSGCGKTSAIFHAARESFCILLTASWEGNDEKVASHTDPGGFDDSFSRLVADIKTIATTVQHDDSTDNAKKRKVEEECEHLILAFIISRMLMLWSFQQSRTQPDKLAWLMYQLTPDLHAKAIAMYRSLKKKPADLLRNLKFVLQLKLKGFFFAFDEAQEGHKYLSDEHLWKSKTRQEYRGIACPIIRKLSGTAPLVIAGTAMSLVSIESCKSDIGKPQNTKIIQEFPQVSIVEITERMNSLLNMEKVKVQQSSLLKLEGRGRLLGGFFRQLEIQIEEMPAESSKDVFSSAIQEHYNNCRDQIVSRIRSKCGMSKQEEEEKEEGDKLLDRRGKKRLPESIEILATASLVGTPVSIRYKRIRVDLLNIGLCSVRMVNNQGDEFVLDEELGRDAILQVAHEEGYYSESLERVLRLCQSRPAVGAAMEPLIVAELRGWCENHPNSTVRDFLSAACEGEAALPHDLPSWIDKACFSVVCGETKAGYLAKGVNDDVEFMETAVKDVSYRNKLLSPSIVKRPDFEAVMGQDISKDAWFLSISSKLYSSTLDDKTNNDFRSTKPHFFYTQRNGRQNTNCKNFRRRWLKFMKGQHGLFRRCLRIHVCLPEVERPEDDPRRLFVDEDGSIVLYITSKNIQRVFSEDCLVVLKRLGNLQDERTDGAEGMVATEDGDKMDAVGDTGNTD